MSSQLNKDMCALLVNNFYIVITQYIYVALDFKSWHYSDKYYLNFLHDKKGYCMFFKN